MSRSPLFLRLLKIPRGSFLLVLLGAFSLLAAWASIKPLDRGAWALENALVAVAIPLLFATYRSLPLSRVSYGLIFLFLCLHEVGSHYTYEKVPYEEAFKSLTGLSVNGVLGWERNNYDRVVHFAYGLLLAYPIREIVLRVGDLKGFWGYFLPLDVTMSTSMLYELVEWGAAGLFGGGSGMAYLGVQGDVWDAHKDMLFASLGAVLAMGMTAAVNGCYQRDFAREWIESLRVKKPRPLGEEELARMQQTTDKRTP